MIISKGLYIKRNFVLFGLGAMIFLTSLGYFLGWKVEIPTLLIYILVIILEIVVTAFIFVILIKTNKKFYRFDIDKNVFLITKNSEEFVLSFSQIIKVFYVRFFWTILLQMGGGYLHIQYKNKDATIINTYISISPKDVKRLERMFKIEIEVR